jgi:hypothetical protein
VLSLQASRHSTHRSPDFMLGSTGRKKHADSVRLELSTRHKAVHRRRGERESERDRDRSVKQRNDNEEGWK